MAGEVSKMAGEWDLEGLGNKTNFTYKILHFV